MTPSTSSLRPYATAGIALVGAGIIAVTPVVPAPAHELSGVRLTDGEVGLIVGGTGIPIPNASAEFPDYMQQANDLFIQRILPGAVSQPVFTPEGGSPIYTGVKSLPFDQSFAQGTTILTQDIENQVHDGNTVAVYGESQSSTISGMVMPILAQDGIAAGSVKFVLVGDPSNPDGGLLERFAPLQLPALGIDFGTPTPADSIYDTAIYTQEYDGFADFPKYTLNVLADLNAFLGIEDVHPTYRTLTDAQLTPVGQTTPDGEAGTAIQLPTADGYDGNTTYYMVPMASDQVLPLLRPLEAIPIIGKPLADLLNPDLTQIVNLGYDNPANDGWDVGQANVPTDFGLFPSLGQLWTALQNMVPGTIKGIDDFFDDILHPAAAATTAATTTGTAAAFELPSLTDVFNAFSGALSQAYSVLLPTADIANSLLINMPIYDINLFTQNIFSNPIEAFLSPLAADTGLVTLAVGIEFMTIEQAVKSITADFTGLF